MKKRSAAFLSLCLIVVCLFPTCAFAANTEKSQSIAYFDDGSYVITTVSVTNTAATRASKTRVGSIKHDYHDAGGDLDWSASMTATFTYDGSTSRCTSANTPEITIYNNIWSVYSKSSSKNGNTATGNVTMAAKQIIGSSKFPVTLTLTCDKNGVLS